jgi:hypothetical protein
MIHITRAATSPTVLTTSGVTAAQAHCAAYDSAPDEYRNGTRTFTDSDFDRSIYAAEEVKEELRKVQHRKCAFCESSFDHIAYGDIEHFRPKGVTSNESKTHSGAPATTGSFTSGQISSTPASFATNDSSETSFLCEMVAVEHVRIDTISRTKMPFSLTQQCKIRWSSSASERRMRMP